MTKFIKLLFFGNYFYGLCVLSLTIEATLQQNIVLLHPIYYTILFLGTIVYYTKAYTHINDPLNLNPRIRWYSTNKNNIKKIQFLLYVVLLLSSCYYLFILSSTLKFNTKYLLESVFYISIFPFAALLYYGLSSKGISENNLRNIGWLKPIIIGFTWAGVVTIYPIVFANLESGVDYNFSIINLLFFIKNMMYVLILAIMFDIKDYASDYNKEIKTFVVKYGLRTTIFSILIPLSIIGLGSFLTFALMSNFSILKIIINTIPFITLFVVIYSMKKRRSILYYLMIIDGLMFLKGVCGAIGMQF